MWQITSVPCGEHLTSVFLTCNMLEAKCSNCGAAGRRVRSGESYHREPVAGSRRLSASLSESCYKCSTTLEEEQGLPSMGGTHPVVFRRPRAHTRAHGPAIPSQGAPHGSLAPGSPRAAPPVCRVHSCVEVLYYMKVSASSAIAGSIIRSI